MLLLSTSLEKNSSSFNGNDDPYECEIDIMDKIDCPMSHPKLLGKTLQKRRMS